MKNRGEADGDGRADEVEKRILAFTILGLTVSLLLSAVARRFFPEWYAPVIRVGTGFLIWMAALGSARAAETGLHIRVAFLADIVSPDSRRRLHCFADVVFLLFAAAVMVIGCSMLRYSLVHPSPRGHPIIYLALPVGMGLTIFRLVRRIRQSGRETE